MCGAQDIFLLLMGVSTQTAYARLNVEHVLHFLIGLD